MVRHVSTVSREDRQRLAEAKVTLNGEPARIGGTRNEFATVTQVHSGLSAEWSWEAAQRVVANGGKFKS